MHQVKSPTCEAADPLGRYCRSRHRRHARGSPSYQAAYSREQLPEVERFGQIVVGADLETNHPVQDFALAADDENAGGGFRAQIAHQRETVLAGKPQIHEYDVWRGSSAYR
ncbi:hypothetical protein RZS08_14810, partial [Arthrospira platensis SPKY1]|nr:hypothetical protein [Arthrospira platensis SPKY1]